MHKKQSSTSLMASKNLYVGIQFVIPVKRLMFGGYFKVGDSFSIVELLFESIPY